MRLPLQSVAGTGLLLASLTIPGVAVQAAQDPAPPARAEAVPEVPPEGTEAPPPAGEPAPVRAEAATAPSPAEPLPLEKPAPSYETTVTALRLPRPLPDVPSTVTVMTREELDAMPALTADEVVRALPSAGTFRRSPSLTADPTSQGLNLRGIAPSAVSRALVLLDGVPVTQPFGGWIYWRSLPRLGLERIEVVPGGTSALFGNAALGGVVQMFSRPIENRIEADASLGSLGLQTAAVAAGVRRGSFGAALEAEAFQSDGYIPVSKTQRGPIDQPANSRHGAVNARVAWQPRDTTRLGAHLRLFDESQNGGTKFTTARPRTASLGLTLNHGFSGVGAISASVFGGLERFEQQRARVAMGRVSEDLAARQKIDGDSLGAGVMFTGEPVNLGGQHVLMVGVDALRTSGTSDEQIFPPTVTGMSVVGRRAGGEQQFLGAFIQDVYAPARWLELSLALRLDHWGNRDGERSIRRQNGMVAPFTFDDRSATQLNPRLGLLVKPAERWRIRSTAYTAFRAPTLNELYRPFQVGTIMTAANDKLGAERILGADLGVEYLLGTQGAVRVTGFANQLRDPILNVTLAMPLPDGSMRQRQNLGRVDVRGLEASLDVRLFQYLVASLAYTAVDAKVGEAADADLVGKRLPQDPIHRGRAALRFAHPRWFTASVQVRAQSRQFEDDQNQLPMGGFAALDLFAAVPLYKGVEVYALAENVLDQEYLVGRAGVDTIGPPRLVLAGLRFR